MLHFDASRRIPLLPACLFCAAARTVLRYRKVKGGAEFGFWAKTKSQPLTALTQKDGFGHFCLSITEGFAATHPKTDSTNHFCLQMTEGGARFRGFCVRVHLHPFFVLVSTRPRAAQL